jgi:hypothetical protein
MDISSDYEWRFETQKVSEHVDEAFLRSIHQVYLDGFSKTQGWSLKGIQDVVTRSSVRGFLRKRNEVVGYAFYSVPAQPLDGTHMLWENAICLKKDAQGHGLTRGIIEKVIDLFPNVKFGWIGGRTQNPLVFKRYSDLGKIFPFVARYDTDEGRKIMDFVLKHIPQATTFSGQGFVDRTNGVCSNAYSGGRLGEYSTNVPATEAFEKQLRDWGFKRENGDAVLVVSRLSRMIRGPSV